MIDLANKSDCSGCGACRDVCPVNAISLTADSEGFLYPQTDAETCIQCDKCKKQCPILSGTLPQNSHETPCAYAAQTKDETVRERSSSGGVFTEIASYILRTGGVVFGAAFTEHFQVVHIGIEHIEDLDKLRGSKYVQSEIGETYLQAKTHLDAGRPVLFTGTPCQIGGLYSFLGRNYNHLYTQDIICHGVPSPMVWLKYVQYREAKARGKLSHAYFRHKQYGWHTFSMCLDFQNGTQLIQPLSRDIYLRSFLRNLCLRPSCYHCAFKTKQRIADFTLADFWGIDKVYPSIDDDKGTSLVILHSHKGKLLFDAIKECLIYRETEPETATRYNSAMTSSVPYNKNRDAFMQTVSEKGFSGVRKYLRTPVHRKLRQMIGALARSLRSGRVVSQR